MSYKSNVGAFIFQLPVYITARDNVVKNDLTSVLDIGCGNPQKLKAYILPFTNNITGIDLPEIVEKIDQPFGRWIGADLDEEVVDTGMTFDMIIAADVIEHIENISNLVETIKVNADENTMIVISTPEKDSLSTNPDGSSMNRFHVKEYTREEMCILLSDNGFIVDRIEAYKDGNLNSPYVSNIFLCSRGE